MMPLKDEVGSAVARMYRNHLPLRNSTLPVTPSLERNRLLAALPPEDYARLGSMLERAPLPRGMVIYEAGGTLQHVYFPVTGIVSVMCGTGSGKSAEVAMVGNDGVVGIPLFLAAGAATNSRAVVRCAGHGYRLAATCLLREFERGEVLLRTLLGYTQAFIGHVMQASSCVRHHTLDQRLCRWLLSGLDRMCGDELPITHEAIAESLGVRREGVTLVVHTLQQAGIIVSGHRRIAVRDRTGLESRTCGCYSAFDKDTEGLTAFPSRCAAKGGASRLSHHRERRLPAPQMSLV